MAENKRALGAYPDYRQIPDADVLKADKVLLKSGGEIKSPGGITWTGILAMGSKKLLLHKRSSAPAVGDLSDGEIVMSDDSTYRRLYIRISGVLYYITLV